MAELKVIKMGNPKLREASEPVDPKTITTPLFQQFIDDLIQTMRTHDGAGIAAPQVGRMQRAFVMEVDNNVRYPDKGYFPLYIAINPTITPINNEMQDSWEGCLSIPDIRGKLKRYKHVLLKATDNFGHEYAEELTGFASVVAQHELDHLNGKLFIDRMTSMETLSFDEEYQKFWI